MYLDINKNQTTTFTRFAIMITVTIGFLLKISQADNRPPNQVDCANIQEIAAILPPHITAFYGMGRLSHVENIHTDLDRTLALLLARDKSKFNWKSIDFEEIIIECQLAWRDENIKLFNKIQQRVNLLTPALTAIHSQFPEMSALEAGQWLGEGVLAGEIQQWKKSGLSPFKARLEKMRIK
jgi:hypothetical protein